MNGAQWRDARPAAERHWQQTAGGALLLWLGLIAFGATTVVLLAVLSRRGGHGSFAGLSTLLGLAFACSLVPTGVLMRCAALVTDGQPLRRMAPSRAVAASLLCLGTSPIVAVGLRLPVLSVLFIACQLVAGVVLAWLQGAMLGQQRFAALGVNQLIEGAARTGLGVWLGLVWGVTGLALAMFLSTAVAVAALPRRWPVAVAAERPTTSLLDTSLALVLLGVFVQLDVLLAPRALHSATTRYDLAAVPSKGVYLVLLALGPLLFPFVRRSDSRRLIIIGAALTLVLGTVLAAALVGLRPLIGAVLGQPDAPAGALFLLGVAMSLVAATAVFMNGAIARGVVRPWPPIALGMVALVACTRTGTVMGFATACVLVHLVVTAAALWVVLWGRRDGSRHEPQATRSLAPSPASP